MANWLEGAKREIPAATSRATAKTAKGNATAVMAVREPKESEDSLGSIGSNGSAPPANFQETTPAAPMTAHEESAIRAWLAHIGETDAATIADVLTRCRADADARGYFIVRSGEAQGLAGFNDDRRRCDQCTNLTKGGLCLAARRGEIVAARGYEPIRDLLRRCEGYAPGPDDRDRRPGPERWPGLVQIGNDHANV